MLMGAMLRTNPLKNLNNNNPIYLAFLLYNPFRHKPPSIRPVPGVNIVRPENSYNPSLEEAAKTTGDGEKG